MIGGIQERLPFQIVRRWRRQASKSADRVDGWILDDVPTASLNGDDPTLTNIRLSVVSRTATHTVSRMAGEFRLARTRAEG